MTNPDSIQHINIKVFTQYADTIRLADAVPVFHRRRGLFACTRRARILLIGHEANYSMDNRENRLRLLYNRKAVVDGTFQSRLQQAHEAALAACDKLEQEPVFQGKLKFNRNALEVFVNDGLLAPNNEETWQLLRPELEKAFAGFQIERSGEPRDLFRVRLTG